MNGPPVVLHIGFAKAASTTLQDYFQSAPDIVCVGSAEVAYRFACQNPFTFSLQAVEELVGAAREQAKREGKVLVVTHERLAGNPHSGHYDCREIAQRLYQAFPGARVIVSIREQMAMLASIYKQYVRIGGCKTLEEYLLPVFDCRVPLFDWRIYEYHPLVRYYMDLFGPRNVMVPLVEELAADGVAYFERLCAFIGTEPPPPRAAGAVHNVGLRDEEVEPTRVRNFFRNEAPLSLREPHPLQRPGLLRWYDRVGARLVRGGYGPSHSVEKAVRTLFAGRFAAANRELSVLLDRDLAAYGYEVA